MTVDTYRRHARDRTRAGAIINQLVPSRLPSLIIYIQYKLVIRGRRKVGSSWSEAVNKIHLGSETPPVTIEDSSFHVMSSACEDSCPWTNYLSEAINKCVVNLLSLLSVTFGLTYNSNDVPVVDDETSLRFRESLDELIALLSFDEFQLQLLKIFLLTFACSVALIFVAWHVYGSRITEQFMKAGNVI